MRQLLKEFSRLGERRNQAATILGKSDFGRLLVLTVGSMRGNATLRR